MKNLFLFLSFVLFIGACKKDDDNPDNNSNTATMTVEKDGTSYTVTSFTNTLVSADQFGQTGKRLDIRAEVDGGTLVLSVSNWSWQNPPENGILIKTYDTADEYGPNTECMDIGGAMYCDGALGTYIVGTSNSFTPGDSDDKGFITIVKNDSTKKTVSGNFEFIVEDFFGNGSNTFKGTFTDLKY